MTHEERAAVLSFCAVLRISCSYPRLHPFSPRLLHSLCSTRHGFYTANCIRCIVSLSGTHSSEDRSSYSVYHRKKVRVGDPISGFRHASLYIDTAGRANIPRRAFFSRGFSSVLPMCVVFRVHKAAIVVNDMSPCTAPHCGTHEWRAVALAYARTRGTGDICAYTAYFKPACEVCIIIRSCCRITRHMAPPHTFSHSKIAKNSKNNVCGHVLFYTKKKLSVLSIFFTARLFIL